MTSDVSAREELEYFVLNALWNRPVRSIWLFVLAGISLARSPNNRSLHAFLLGTGAGVLALIHACRTWDDVASMGRYYLAFEGAFVLAALLKSAFDVSESGAPGNTRAKLGQLVSTADQVQMEYSTWARRIETQLWKPSAVDAEDGVYRRLQRAIPAGASFIEILDQPYRLDFQRNHILVCDQPGGASALRGLPIYGDVQLEQLENRHKTVFHEGQIRVLDSALPAPH